MAKIDHRWNHGKIFVNGFSSVATCALHVVETEASNSHPRREVERGKGKDRNRRLQKENKKRRCSESQSHNTEKLTEAPPFPFSTTSTLTPSYRLLLPPRRAAPLCVLTEKRTRRSPFPYMTESVRNPKLRARFLVWSFLVAGREEVELRLLAGN
ncbi:hypothetical protein V8G54_037715 [Vigna mungo]|uniref:Uncharacterized protein n=1 Tax=Vigna mungo TaxID=3915 RepID=A0AAQ3RFM4_VIGMU